MKHRYKMTLAVFARECKNGPLGTLLLPDIVAEHLPELIHAGTIEGVAVFVGEYEGFSDRSRSSHPNPYSDMNPEMFNRLLAARIQLDLFDYHSDHITTEKQPRRAEP